MACKQENKKKFCPHAGSNYRPSVYKTDALPLSYRGHLVLPISHNLNDTTFFLTHYYSSLLFTTTIKFARARELELKIQNKHRNTQFPSLSLSLNGRRKQHLRSCTLQIPSKFQFPYHFISTTFYLFIIISFTFQDLIHAIFKLVWTRRALGLRNLLSLFKVITFFNLCS